MAIRESLLALLTAGDIHGYQLKTTFEKATGGVWPLNVGQVYATLDRLARDGLVDVTERDGQRTYDITADGLEELGAWWDTVPADQPPPRDELILKVLLSLTQGADHALGVITRQRGALLGLLQARQSGAALSRRKPQSLAETLVRDALVVRAEADLRWLDLCEERLAAASSAEVSDGPDQPARRRGAKR
ncbi:MAG: hypothetical protein QOJ23_3661 [Actinomycetota bacterium]|nr:hypothetical protein [Actinomycetota bacterium]MDQ1501366.1 hypothetical protein [Actinomycetota bacterium]